MNLLCTPLYNELSKLKNKETDRSVKNKMDKRFEQTFSLRRDMDGDRHMKTFTTSLVKGKCKFKSQGTTTLTLEWL